MKTYTREEFEQKYGADILPQIEQRSSGGFLSRIGTSLKDSFLKGKAQVQGTGEFEDSIAPVRGAQLAGTLAMTIPKAVLAGAIPEAGQEFLAEKVAKPIGEGFKTVTDLIGSSPTLQNFVMENPTATKIIEETAKVTGALSETASGLLATQGIAKTGMGAVNLAKTGATKTVELASRGVDLAKTGATKTGDFLRGARDVVKPIIQEAKTLPQKARVNVAQTRATEATIKTLPKIGQTAVRSGVGLSDVKTLYQIPKNVAKNIKPLVKAVQNFASGKSKVNPLEMVGKPIIKAFKTAQSKATTIGSKLGKVSEGLGNVTTKQTFPKVFEQLKKVSGLQGLKVNSKGVLDFSGTNLASALSKADRVAIQKIFTDAIKAGTGKSKHLYRQELFNILGGKKTGLAQLTGTQENAFNAIRKGLSDVLDDLNPTYKALNAQYAKAISPINRLQKLLRSAGVDDDLLNMKAGLLARRLTSFSKSNPEIRQILRDLDKAITTKGTTLMKTEQLQDLYNVLDKYYDIAGQTGFQGQVTAGVSKALDKGGVSKLIDIAEGQVTRVLGETDIVKQRALEEILKEILGS
jgi:hypothetical protein